LIIFGDALNFLAYVSKWVSIGVTYMCRLLHFVSVGELNNLFVVAKAFRLSTLHDVFLDEVRRGRRSHNHGWGAAFVYMKFRELGFGYFKTSLPLLEEDFRGFVRGVPRGFHWIHMIMHSRLTVSEPINVFNSHPFHISIPGNINLWFVHNGSINKAVVAKELGLENLLDRYADSFFVAYWIAKTIDSVDSSSITKSLKKLVDLGVVETALNCAGIVVDEPSGKVVSFSLNYIGEKGEKTKNYYQLYKVMPSRNTVVVVSSTVDYYLNSLAGLRGTPLENGEIVVVEVKDNALVVENQKI